MSLLAIKLLAQYTGRRVTPVRRVVGVVIEQAVVVCWGRKLCQQQVAAERRQTLLPHPKHTASPPLRQHQDAAVAMVSEWLADSACNRNPYVRLVAGLIYAQEGNEVEALKALNSGGGLTLEM